MTIVILIFKMTVQLLHSHFRTPSAVGTNGSYSNYKPAEYIEKLSF